MISIILEQYKVAFSTPLAWKGLRAASSSNAIMSQFIEDHYTVRDANRLLLGIEEIITEQDLNGGGFFTQSLQIAVINAIETKIYNNMDEYDNDNNIPPAFILPTQHFKEIVEAWKNYLES